MFSFIKKLFKSKSKTKKVKTRSGMTVELDKDQPDELAEMMEEVFKSGEPMIGEINEKGEFSYKKMEKD